MKKTVVLLSSSMLAAALASPALAGNYDRPEKGMMKGEHKMEKGDMKMGKHSMTGKIDQIDHAKGTLVVKHSAADMLLHFPPAAIKDLKNGDTITVYLGFSKETGE